MSGVDTQPTENEREQIEEDIERLKLALQADGEKEDFDSDDENAQLIAKEENDFEPQPSTSFASIERLEEDDEDDNEGTHDLVISTEEIDELPVNVETCLILNRTYQDIVLDLLRKIEVSLSENRSKQSELEEGLEENNKSGKRRGKQKYEKNKPMGMFSVPYFKDVDGQAAPPNGDVAIKQMTKEEKQDINPPMPWNSDQRSTLLEAVRQDALKLKMMPLMNRKEIFVEKLDHIKLELTNIDTQKAKIEYIDEEEVMEQLDILVSEEKEKTNEKENIEGKIRELNREISHIRRTPSTELLMEVDVDMVDWLKISNTVFHGKRDETECLMMWKNVLHPSINKESWGTEEVYKLQKLAKSYNMKNWPAIAKELGTNRTPFQCLQYYQKNLSDNFNKRAWSKEEDEMLSEVVENCQIGGSISWHQVSYFLDDRSSQQCFLRWKQINPKVKRGKWDTTEDTLLLSAVRIHGNKNWRAVKTYLPNRTVLQCRERYFSALDPSLKAPSVWSYEEDKALLALVAEEQELSGGKVRWVQVASRMVGRTDNMIYTRYKRLMGWKDKCEWAEKQSEEQQRAMGLVSLRRKEGASKRNAMTSSEVTETNKALNHIELSTGVKKEDYLKQLEDVRKGEIPVPRPPLSYRYSTRNFKTIWNRKLRLHNLIEQHLSKTLRRKHLTPEAREQFPKDTAIALWPFSKLPSRLQNKVQSMLAHKDPNQVSVAEILQLSNMIGGEQKRIDARLKRFKSDSEIEEQMKDIVFWKMYHCLQTRKNVGRPKKFYIFSPTGRKSDYVAGEEDVEQLTGVTATLLMNALEVDQKKAISNYQNKTDKSNPDYAPDLAILKQFMPLSKQPPPQSTSSQTEIESEASPVPGPSTARSTLAEQSSKNPRSVGHNNQTVANKVCPQTKNAPKQTALNLQPKILRLPPGARIIHLQPGQQIKPGMIIPLASQMPATQLAPVQSSGALKTTANKPLKKPTNKITVEIQKQPEKGKVSRIKMLPPSVTSARAFQGLLLQRRLLIHKANQVYNKYYYKAVGRELQRRANELKKIRENAKETQNATVTGDKLDLNKVINEAEKPSALVVKQFCKKPKQATKKIDQSDKLESLRGTRSYKLLRARFQAIFTWPSLLSTIVPPKDDPSRILTKQSNESEYTQGRKRKNSPDQDDAVRQNSGDDSRVPEVDDQNSVSDTSVPVKRRKIRYALVNGKSVYKRAVKGKEWREKNREFRRQVQEKIRLQKSSLEDGEVILSATEMRKMEATQRRMEKYAAVERRSSGRIAERRKQDVETPVNEPEVKVQKKRRRKKYSYIAETNSLPYGDTVYNALANDGQNVSAIDNSNLRGQPQTVKIEIVNDQNILDCSSDNLLVSQRPHTMREEETDKNTSNEPLFYAVPVGQYDEETGNVEINTEVSSFPELDNDNRPIPTAMVRNLAFTENE